MASAHIALATSADHAHLVADDRLLVDWLRQQGHSVSIVVWDQEATPADCDLTIVRSCWDYHRKPAAFLQWIDAHERRGHPLLNDPQTLRWNHDKGYLADLAEKGIATAETEWVARGSTVHLEEILERRGWREGVIKPQVSASAQDTHRVPREQAAALQPTLAALVERQDVMVQRFVPEIVTDGELSLMLFDGEPSHAVRKRAQSGDYRVQEEYAGTVEVIEPDEVLWRQAAQVLETLPTVPLYARVDGPVVQGSLLVLELELIEPALFLRTHDRAAARFGAAALSRISS